MAKNIKDKYLLYTHNTLSITTIQDLVAGEMQTTVCYGMNLLALLAYQDESGEPNIKKIWKMYLADERAKYEADYTSDLILVNSFNSTQEVEKGLEVTEKDSANVKLQLLKLNTQLVIPIVSVNTEFYPILSNTVVPSLSSRAFVTDMLAILQKDIDGYRKVYKNYNGLKKTSVFKNLPTQTVWIWCKAFGTDNFATSGDLPGQIINITPFITNLSISMAKTGGTFSFTLPPLVATHYSDGWKLQNVRYQSNVKELKYISKDSMYFKDNKDRNQFFFHNLISENDVVFIRFETLKREIIPPTVVKNIKSGNFVNRLDSTNLLEIPDTLLPGNIYDMIGLVDSNNLTSDAASLKLDITIQGRDLTKLLTEDGCYFFPLDYVPGGIFANEAEKDYVDRIDGKLMNLLSESVKSIDYTLKFIINTLAKIKITSNKLFIPYGDADDKTTKDLNSLGRSKTFKLDIASRIKKTESIENLYSEKSKAVEKIRDSQKLENINFTQSAALAVFNGLYDFIKFLKDNDYIVVTGETISWTVPKDIEYLNEILATNEFPSIFDNNFYLENGYWYDPKGHSASDLLKMKELIDQLEEELKQFDIDANNIYSVRSDAVLATTKSGGTANVLRKQLAFDDFVDNMSEYYQKLLVPKQDNTQTPDLTPSDVKTKADAKVRKLEALKDKYRDYDINMYYAVNPTNCKTLYARNKPAEEAMQMIYQYLKKEEENNAFVETYNPEYLKGIWQIIKLVVDEDNVTTNKINSGANIATRRIADSSIGNDNGTLQSAIQKICQEPFVEFFGDTYGDQYYFIARQPPFTYDAYKDLSTYAIDIFEEDVISDNFYFDYNCAYSWYRITPQGSFTDLGEDTVLAYIKALHFKEYADIWGEKPFEIVSNYIEHHSVVGDKGDFQVAYLVKQALYDLKFLIDTNMYLPFTRKGTITIEGDRRIKIGTMINYKGTGEVFYVDAVTNDFSISNDNINRTTTLTVSRGMVKHWMHLYFKIINTNIDEKLLNEENPDYNVWIRTLYENFMVDKNIFDFLLKRKQFVFPYLPDPSSTLVTTKSNPVESISFENSINPTFRAQ